MGRNLLAWALPASRVVLGLLILVASIVYATEDGSAGGTSIPMDDSSGVVMIGGVLRRGTSSHWGVYENGHAHRGVASVTCARDGRLIVELRPRGYMVGFGVATPDEHLAAAGVTNVGVSAGPGELRLFFYRNGKPLSCKASVFRERLSNVWLLWAQPVR